MDTTYEVARNSVVNSIYGTYYARKNHVAWQWIPVSPIKYFWLKLFGYKVRKN